MKRLVLAGLIAAFAAVTPASAARDKIAISPDQRTKISAYVSQEKVKPVTFRQRLNRGSKIDSAVVLNDVPVEWGAELGKYKFVYSNDDRVLFVDPNSRAVVDAIKVSR
jgi:hypothetical protein